jgi:DNA primase
VIGEDDIRRVRDATDIVALIGERIVLKQRGREFWGCCPFHNEKTASFKVDPVSQFYYCFGCGEGGDAFKFLMKTENIEFPDAIRALAQRANIELAEELGTAPRGRKAQLLAVCEEAAAFYHQQLMRVKSPESDAARNYLTKRGMGGATSRDWQLGFAPGQGALVRHLQQKGFARDELVEANVALVADTGRHELRDRFYNRIMFPIRDLQGRAIAFGGRVIGQGEPKYLNSSDTLLFHKGDNLFAIDKAKAAITAGGSVIVVEGYTDVIAMHAAGFTNTVATLGTALTPQHLKLLSRFSSRVVLLFDGDEAGARAAGRAADLIGVVAVGEIGRKADLFVAMLPGAADPADFCAAKGPEAMQLVLDAAVPLLRFALDRRLMSWDLTLPEQRARALEDVVRLLVPVKGSLLAADYLNYLADVFATDYQLVASALERAKPLPTHRASDADGQAAGQATGQVAGPAATSSAAAGGRASGAKASSSSASFEAFVGRLAAFERELLFLYIEHPEVRARIREAFGRIVWSDERHGAIASALLDFEADEEPDALLSRLIAHMPQAADLLAGVRLPEFAGTPPNRMAGMLMFSIREGQLKQAIRDKNARLRRLGEGEAEERDELFFQVAKLQQELSELRKKYRTE